MAINLIIGKIYDTYTLYTDTDVTVLSTEFWGVDQSGKVIVDFFNHPINSTD